MPRNNMSKLPMSHGGAKATDGERRIETASGERLNAVQNRDIGTS